MPDPENGKPIHLYIDGRSERTYCDLMGIWGRWSRGDFYLFHSPPSARLAGYQNSQICAKCLRKYEKRYGGI